jgi:hypothetical protein
MNAAIEIGIVRGAAVRAWRFIALHSTGSFTAPILIDDANGFLIVMQIFMEIIRVYIMTRKIFEISQFLKVVC